MRKQPEPILKVLGSNILYFRRMRGLSQEELGFRANLHQTYVSGVERAKRQPTVTTASNIATALEVQLSELVTERREAIELWDNTFGK